jgi:hypothetical protein
MRRPFNAIFRRDTALTVFDALAAPDVPLAGIIFHMSRCGSTLAARMLSCVPSLRVLSEPQPVDGVIRWLGRGAEYDEVSIARKLRGVVRAFDRGDGRRIVLKVHAWHVLHIPLYVRAFPGVPWAFMFREPRAVLSSQERNTGVELAGAVPASLLGIADPEELNAPDYGARVLAAFCDAAARHAADANALLIDYAELPGATWTRLAPFFGISPTAEELAEMRAAAAVDAKRPRQPFLRESDRTSEAAARHAARWLDAPYSAIRTLARASTGRLG